uniref:IMS_C domain-containing protein n=1 Tax=Parastrongyloides trichosuri TaxID=131310 RepID=A0A0N5A7H7_PARTI
MGENGVTIWNKANGNDNSLVVPYRDQKSMSKETTYEQDTIDMVVLKKTLIKMVDHLAFDLRKEKKLTGCITLKIRYSNFDTHTQQIKIPYTNSDKDLFNDTLEDIELMNAIDHIKNKYGIESIMKGICLPEKRKGGEHATQFA